MKKVIFLLFILTNFLFASVGQITALKGEIKISRDSNTILAKLGEKLEKSDVINSSKASKAQITLDDNTIITIGQNSTLNIFDYAFDETQPKEAKANLGFMRGSFKSITGKIGKINKERFKLKTKSASIGIRGTTIIGNQRMIAVTDGAISVTANGVTVNVGKQEFTQTPQGAAPTPPEPLTPETLNTLDDSGNTGGGDNRDGGEAGNGDDEGKPKNPEERPRPRDINKVVDDTTENTNNDDIKTRIDTKRDEAANNSVDLSGYGLVGYAGAGYYNASETLESFVVGPIGMNYDSTTETDSTYKMYIGNNNSTFTDGIISFTNSEYDDVNSETIMRWGEWQSLGYDNNGNGYSGSWIVGKQTAENVVQNIMDGTTTSTATFQGNIVGGFVKNGLDTYIINTANSSINLDFTFGNNTNSFTGNLDLEYGGNTLYININSGSVSSNGFSSSNLTSSSIGEGVLNGAFYGTGEIKAVGGDFTFDNKNGISAAGVYKALPINAPNNDPVP